MVVVVVLSSSSSSSWLLLLSLLLFVAAADVYYSCVCVRAYVRACLCLCVSYKPHRVIVCLLGLCEQRRPRSNAASVLSAYKITGSCTIYMMYHCLL